MWHFPEAAADSPCSHVSASRLLIICLSSLCGPILYTRSCEKTRWRLKWPASSHGNLEHARPLHSITLWDSWVCTAFTSAAFIFSFSQKKRTAWHHLHTVVTSGMKGKQHLKEDSPSVRRTRVWGFEGFDYTKFRDRVRACVKGIREKAGSRALFYFFSILHLKKR